MPKFAQVVSDYRVLYRQVSLYIRITGKSHFTLLFQNDIEAGSQSDVDIAKGM